jgi:hypothetical protein
MWHLNRIARYLDDTFDAFLNGALFPLLMIAALLVYVVRS